MCWIFDPKISKHLACLYYLITFSIYPCEVVVKYYSLFYKRGTNEAERDLRDLLKFPDQVNSRKAIKE